MRGLILLVSLIIPLAAQSGPPDVSSYQSVLDRFVSDDGSVDYAGIKSQPASLDLFVASIGTVSPDSHPQHFDSRQARLAYWINAYNALVLWAMAKDFPGSRNLLASTLRRADFFYRRTFQVGGKARTLASIEDDSLRRGFREPRIHFSIVCASRGCPWLAKTAFRPENIEELLEARARLFWGQDRNLRTDTQTRRLLLSSIFKWFQEDFGSTEEARLDFLARYRPTETALARRGRYRLTYLDYDWSLNLRAGR